MYKEYTIPMFLCPELYVLIAAGRFPTENKISAPPSVNSFWNKIFNFDLFQL